MPRKKGSKNKIRKNITSKQLAGMVSERLAEKEREYLAEKKGELIRAEDILAKSPDSIKGDELPSGTPHKLRNSFKELVGEPYKLTLKSVGRVYKSEGATLKEALAGIKVMGNAKAMAVLVVEKGDRRIEKIIYPQLAHRYFSNGGPTMKEYAYSKITELVGL